MPHTATTSSSRRLARYDARRDFKITPEPRPVRARPGSASSFVIQKHDATRLHYDFRLELDGVLLSWAVPKGPSFDPAQKRLAVQVEDHPIAYGGFEGRIPEGQYGAGDVLVWDRGTWEPVGDAHAGLKAGKLAFRLRGHKLAGLWELVRMHKPGARQPPWLLLKKRDEWARPQAEYDVVSALPDSVIAHPLPWLDAAQAPAVDHDADHGKDDDVDVDAVAALPGAVKRALPRTLAPQLATLARSAPTGDDWLYEIKFDGYRLLTRIEHGRATIFTRSGKDWTQRFQPLADELARLGLESGWLDGEAVALDTQGRSRFNALQNALDAARSEALVCYLFDLPFANGHDLREVPLHERRALLRRLVAAHPGGRVRFSEDFPAGPADVLRAACDLQLEGVIAKRRGGAYTSTRSADWLKLKCESRQEFVIAGFADRSDNAAAVGALLLGVHDADGRLRYAGRVGTGWSAAGAAALRAKLAPLVAKASPFAAEAGAVPPPGAADHWVRPVLVAEIRFSEWTPDGRLRHPSFQGLREDKPADAVRREVAAAPRKTAAAPAQGARRAAAGAAPAKQPAPRATPAARGQAEDAAEVAGIRITHPGRVIDGASGCTKLELARYYESIAEWMLPHLRARPVALVRAPSGVAGPQFFQRHAQGRAIPGMKLLPGLWEGHAALLEIPDAQAIVAAAQWNVIEFHAWNSPSRRIDRPDRMIFDLDPGAGVQWPQMQEAATLVRALLDELGLRSWLKTSGGKGLHVVVPLAPRLQVDAVKEISLAIVRHLAATIPQRFVAKSGPANRRGRIFVDALRNGLAATTVAAFSARARPGLGVSMPVAWDELAELRSGAHWTIADARDRMSFRKTDPWTGYWTCRQTLARATKALAAVAAGKASF